MEEINCPICNRELIYREPYTKCISKCYSRAFSHFAEYVKVFEKEFVFSVEDSTLAIQFMETQLENEIAYWKENSKYLMKLLEGENDV